MQSIVITPSSGNHEGLVWGELKELDEHITDYFQIVNQIHIMV